MLDGGSGLSATSARQRQIPMDIIGRWFIVTAVTSVVILIGLTPEAFRTRPALQKPILISKLGEAINSILSI
jgi:hypothetical protein